MLPPPAGYPPPKTQLPHDLVIQFWEDIYADLQATHGLTPAEAFAAIVACRAETDNLVGDMTYHRGSEELARTIAVGWRNGALSYPLAAVPVTPPSAAPVPAPAQPTPSPTAKP